MAERLLRTAPPRTAKYPAKRAVFLVSAGIAAVFCGIGFAVQALTTHATNNKRADPGRIAAGLAGGGVFAASLGAPALKRQAHGRAALARWAKRRGFALHGRDECRGDLDGVPIVVRIAYGRGPYATRGASELVVVVRPDEIAAALPATAGARRVPADLPPQVNAGWLSDSEPFDDVDVIERHLDRLAARAVRRAAPREEA